MLKKHGYKKYSVKLPSILMLSTPSKILIRRQVIFLLFSPENRIRHFLQLSPMESMECQILFSGENNVNITNVLFT